MQRKFVIPFVIPGALTADKTLYFTSPSDCTLIHASACCQTQAAELTIGSSDDDDEFLDTAAVAAGTTPVEFERTDFVDDQYPRIKKGDVVVITIGHGSNCVDLTLVMTFVEG